jgi:hypothetical protein
MSWFRIYNNYDLLSNYLINDLINIVNNYFPFKIVNSDILKYFHYCFKSFIIDEKNLLKQYPKKIFIPNNEKILSLEVKYFFDNISEIYYTTKVYLDKFVDEIFYKHQEFIANFESKTIKDIIIGKLNNGVYFYFYSCLIPNGTFTVLPEFAYLYISKDLNLLFINFIDNVIIKKFKHFQLN